MEWKMTSKEHLKQLKYLITRKEEMRAAAKGRYYDELSAIEKRIAEAESEVAELEAELTKEAEDEAYDERGRALKVY